MRKLSSIEKIQEIKLIPDADKICAYRVRDGWWVVSKINEFKVGDLVVYCETDAFIPNSLAPFLTKPGHFPKIYEGVEGERLKTIRLKKQISQGLLLSVQYCNEVGGCWSSLEEGSDVSEWLGIIKWEPPQEFNHADAKGNFPDFLRKTDQERVQNCYSDLKDLMNSDATWEVQEKCEGSSITIAHKDGEIYVCSRNLLLKESMDNTFYKTAVNYDVPNKLKELGRNIAIQFELCGNGIMSNIYGLTKFHLFAFDVFDIDAQEYLSPEKRAEIVATLGLTSAPVLHQNHSLKNKSCQDILDFANGISVLGTTNTKREGLVFKLNSDKRVSFKSISNEYLMGQK